MRLELIKYPSIGRSMYVIYPDGDRLCCYENTMVTVLREDDRIEPLQALVRNEAFCALANRQRLVLLFPNPEKGWNPDPNGKDMADVAEMIRLFNYQPSFVDCGIYHNMHNARYFAGFGSGGALAQSFAASRCENVAGIITYGSEICEAAKEASLDTPVSAILWTCGNETADFFRQLNKTDITQGNTAKNSVNGAQFVTELHTEDAPDLAKLLTNGWELLFSKVCRPNTGDNGVMDYRLVRDDYQFIVHENDPLGDNGNIGHVWFEYVPQCVKDDPAKKVPLMIFCHGGADTPGNMANTSKLHQLAEKEGFLLVYPWSTNRWSWNMDMLGSMYDDVAYLDALIEHMKRTYAVDETRIYMAGFSNGSAMSQVFAMVHPEKVAAVFANNTRFAQDRNTKPFAIAGAKKLQQDFRMPVWYVYGTRDYEYPAVRGSGQQIAYDFWKSYNNITCKETPYTGTPGCDAGVEGDVVEVRYPNPQFPDRKIVSHRFFSNDPKPLNLYNYTLVYGKGHDSNPEDGVLAWEFIRKFRRAADGSLIITEE